MAWTRAITCLAIALLLVQVSALEEFVFRHNKISYMLSECEDPPYTVYGELLKLTLDSGRIATRFAPNSVVQFTWTELIIKQEPSFIRCLNLAETISGAKMVKYVNNRCYYSTGVYASTATPSCSLTPSEVVYIFS
ncbi:uncharacterized protein LOC108676139 [Hyalella azteca]|uniref:Uncharacterized protein LOC108676139 n=1 Tax=Hyalella azteca TaxID=294128 RepID=A0A8B7P132_HYAAZ|nr:uncharacterized protein LOC108676139 [Hyalella azteca]